VFAVCQSSEIFWLSDDEIVQINETVRKTADRIAQNGGRRMQIVSSGHIYDDIGAQAELFSRMLETGGTDALVLITNHMDPKNEGDDVWIKNAQALLKRLPSDVKLGLYECPYPYKRLLTPRLLQWAVETERFAFLKDTCCDVDMLAARCAQLQGTSLGLYNANCQTLLHSLRHGAMGYSGIMCNFHPALYVWLCENFEKDPQTAQEVQQFMTLSGFTENGLPYPLSAKYHLTLCGLDTVNYARNVASDRMTEYVRHCMRQMKEASDRLEQRLGISLA
jgi:4-hydroxy-tetrahydrodipicolinate synthase